MKVLLFVNIISGCCRRRKRMRKKKITRAIAIGILATTIIGNVANPIFTSMEVSAGQY